MNDSQRLKIHTLRFIPEQTRLPVAFQEQIKTKTDKEIQILFVKVPVCFGFYLF